MPTGGCLSATFFERNKRKSALAFLLLLIPRARSTIAIVLLVVMFTAFLFGAKSLGMQIPWADNLVRRVAIGASQSDGIGMARLGELAKLLQSNGMTTRSFRGLWGGRGVIASYEQRDSSVKMVKGIKLDGRAGADEDAAAAAHLPKAGRGTNGVPTPDDAQHMAGGVPLNENELLAGLTKNAQGKDGSYGASGADSVDLLKKALQRGHAVSPGSEVQFPGIGGGSWGGSQTLAAFGKGSGSGTVGGNAGAVNITACTSNTCARHNLAEVRALACAAAPPGTACNTNVNCPSGRCPGEYAYHTEDAPYSGGDAGGSILTTQDDPVPVTPDAQASLQGEYASANRDENCTNVFMQGHNSQATYETVLNQQYQACCAQVASTYSNCWTSCTQSCFLGIPFLCTQSCHSQCNPPAKQGVDNCAAQFVSANNQIATTQYSACPNHLGSQNHTLCVQPGDPGCEPWAPQCGSY